MGLENPVHLLLVLVVLLLVFGAKRLPEMGRSIGHGLRGFKDAVGGQSTIEQLEAAPAQTPAQTPAEAPAQTPVATAVDSTPSSETKLAA